MYKTQKCTWTYINVYKCIQKVITYEPHEDMYINVLECTQRYRDVCKDAYIDVYIDAYECI